MAAYDTQPNDAAFSRPETYGREDQFNKAQDGLTKREYMTIRIAAALCSRDGEHDGPDIATAAVNMADDLIFALGNK